MKEILIILNNYLNDIAISMVFITALSFFIITRYAAKGKDAWQKGFLAYISPGMNKLLLYTVIFTVAGMLIRIYNMEISEWGDAERNGQLMPLKTKYAMLLSVFFAGLLLWAGSVVKARALVERRS